jgi:hypothetical protein
MKLIPVYFFSTIMIIFLILYLITPQPIVIFKRKSSSPATYLHGSCYNINNKQIICPIVNK